MDCFCSCSRPASTRVVGSVIAAIRAATSPLFLPAPCLDCLFLMCQSSINYVLLLTATHPHSQPAIESLVLLACSPAPHTSTPCAHPIRPHIYCKERALLTSRLRWMIVATASSNSSGCPLLTAFTGRPSPSCTRHHRPLAHPYPNQSRNPLFNPPDGRAHSV
jgi:hypothetical protein